jgi:phospholipid/cholesterol/gamma-HCH transport system permease protein
MEAAVREPEPPLDVTVSEDAGRMLVRLRGSLEEADFEDARRAFRRLPPVAGKQVSVAIEPQPVRTRASVVLDRFCRMLEAAGATVAVQADPEAGRALAAYAEVRANGAARKSEPFLDRVARFRTGLMDSSARYLTIFRQTVATTASGVLRKSRFSYDDFFLSLKQWGLGAVPLVVLMALLIGAILALQAGPFFERYGQQDLVARLVAVSILREIGPLLTAILIAGRSGSSLAAEIGTMKVSEEVDALEVMGLQPVRILVAPRFLGLLCALPCLVILADIVGILGGLIVGKFALDISTRVYLDHTRQAVELKDVVGGLIKALAYAIVIVTIAAHQGFATRGGASGVGRNTTRTVVLCITWCIVVDMFFTWLLYVADL